MNIAPAKAPRTRMPTSRTRYMSVPLPVLGRGAPRNVRPDGTREVDERPLDRRARLEVVEMRVDQRTHRVDQAQEVDGARLVGRLRHAKRLLRLREVRGTEEVVAKARRAHGEHGMVDV